MTWEQLSLFTDEELGINPEMARERAIRLELAKKVWETIVGEPYAQSE